MNTSTHPTPRDRCSAPAGTRLKKVARCLPLALAMLAVSACSILETRPEDRATIYAPDPQVATDPGWPDVDWQLALSHTAPPRMIDSLRIAVRPSPNELQVYGQAVWAKLPRIQLEDAVLQALQDSGKIPAAARQGTGISADYELALDLRRFESDYTTGAPTPAATIEVNARLLHAPDQRVVAAQTFRQATPAATDAVPDVVRAFEQSLEALASELAGWTLSSGKRHQDRAHR